MICSSEKRFFTSNLLVVEELRIGLQTVALLNLGGRRQHIESGQIVSRTKAEMRKEHGLRPDSLDSLVAGPIQISRGWRLAPRSLLGGGAAVDFSLVQTNGQCQLER